MEFTTWMHSSIHYSLIDFFFNFQTNNQIYFIEFWRRVNYLTSIYLYINYKERITENQLDRKTRINLYGLISPHTESRSHIARKFVRLPPRRLATARRFLQFVNNVTVSQITQITYAEPARRTVWQKKGEPAQGIHKRAFSRSSRALGA